MLGFFGICSTLVRDLMSTQQAGNIVSSVLDSRTIVLQEKILMTSLDTISGQLWGVKHWKLHKFNFYLNQCDGQTCTLVTLQLI